MRYLFMYAIIVYLMIAILSGCTTPVTWTNKYNNLLTPDRLGVGVTNGTMNAHGVSNKFLNNQEEPIQMDIRGDTESTSIWLEWDFPQWRDDRGAERYLRERIRVLEMQAQDEEPEKVY